MKYSNDGLSLVLVMGLMLLVSLTALYIIEYVVPFSRIVKGVENSSQSYYQGVSGVEESMFQIYSSAAGAGIAAQSFSGNQDYAYVIENSGDQIPLPGFGSSEKDRNWNKLSFTDGGSFLIGGGGVSSIDLDVRVPDFDNDGSPDSISNTGSGHILWQVSSPDSSIIAENLIRVDYSGTNLLSNNNNHRGYQVGDTSLTRLRNFYYNNNCDGANKCVLRLTLANPILSSGGNLPFLEYKLSFNNGASVPYQDAYVESGGKSYGFQKRILFSVPQNTTSSAFDFTVFQ